MLQNFLVFKNRILIKSGYWLPLMIVTLVCFGYSVFNATICWDDLMRDFYYGTGGIMLATRWAQVPIVYLLGVFHFSPFIDRFISILFLVFGSVILSFVIYLIFDKNDEKWCYTVASCLFVSFPLITEIFEYGVVCFIVTLNMLLCLITVVLLRDATYKNWLKILIGGFLLIPSLAGFESGAFFYISVVAMLFFLENWNEHEEYGPGKLILYVLPLIIAFFFRIIVSVFLHKIVHVPYRESGATTIMWGHSSILTPIVDTIDYFFMHGLIYLPITIFVLATITFFVSIVLHKSQRRLNILIWGVLFWSSLFSLCILQCCVMPYRTAQSLGLFVAVVGSLLILEVPKKGVKRLLIVAFLFVAWHQSVYCNHVLSLNNLRSQNECAFMQNVAYVIQTKYPEKKLAIVSPYSLSKYYRRDVFIDSTKWSHSLYINLCKILNLKKSRYDNLKIQQTNVNCASEQYNAIQLYFSWLGYDFDVINPRPWPGMGEDDYDKDDRQILRDAQEFAKQHNLRPGQIVEMENYLIVALGDKYFNDDGYFY